MSIDASELNQRIRRRPVLGRIYMVVALIGLVVSIIGLLVFGTICVSARAAYDEACDYIRETAGEGWGYITWTVRHIFNRWDDGETSKSDS